MKWYIAGPMRGYRYYNFPAFDKAEQELLDAGYEVFNPANIDREDGLVVLDFPADYDWHKLPDGMDLDAVISRDCDELATCDGIYMLAGWENSKGARAEHALAEWRGLDIIYEVDPPTQAAPGTKLSNPKDSVGSRKVPMSTVPVGVMMEVGLALLEGACKYRRHNYRVAGVRSSVYYDALWRHMGEWWEGQDVDPQSGVSHIVKAMACLVVLRDAEMQGMLTDDRPPRSKMSVDALNQMTEELLDRFPEPLAPYTQKGIENGDC